MTFAKEIDSLPSSGIRYSICSLVSNIEEYNEMVDSFVAAGFDPSFCEFIYVDNSIHNKYEAYKGLNLFLTKALGDYIILCHQDVLLKEHNIDVLEKRMHEIELIDPSWAIISNAGAVGIKNVVYRVTDASGEVQIRGAVPQKVQSVDEHFILIKAKCNLAFSSDLQGFHLYGTDVCLVAATLGYSAYVVDFNLLHKSKGTPDHKFHQLKKNLIAKYLKAWKGRYIETTITNFYLSGNYFMNLFYSSGFVKFLFAQLYKFKFRKVRNDKF